MPRFDGTGPCGKGPLSGRCAGTCPGAKKCDKPRSTRSGQGLGRGRGFLGQQDNSISSEIDVLKKRIQDLENELASTKEKLSHRD